VVAKEALVHTRECWFGVGSELKLAPINESVTVRTRGVDQGALTPENTKREPPTPYLKENTPVASPGGVTVTEYVEAAVAGYTAQATPTVSPTAGATGKVSERTTEE